MIGALFVLQNLKDKLRYFDMHAVIILILPYITLIFHIMVLSYLRTAIYQRATIV
ncbi:conserved protein of unknown function [Tepidanaerobacter acetatoxydans Re1]|uniref:Uncharacterized protein n=1 Tax=Tepidanaerobacter acetatoxydans (strain DSM 21804 / JCM 16047 / Re1) TaxID=1209989 RepID=F4LVY5_TEPAE|nr:hypothetical protein TepRe1_1507 [Tepidanaerobacter acetatoxydans Re1]CCP26395.1 conserved protein of unknown function [Tepidanaerobacter acetatoxydans Re1]